MRRAFSASWALTVGTVLLCALFIRLGYWQWDKGNARQAQWAEFSRGADKTVAIHSDGLDKFPRFQRVSIVGRYDAEHQFLLDNRSYNGRAGYEVLTPLDRPDGRVALVDRGWVPFTGARARLPSVAFEPQGPVTVTGRTDNLPSAGLASGRAAPAAGGEWPKVTSYPTMSELSAVLGRPLERRILLLDAPEPDGYVRDWHPPGMQPLRHWAYAIQWWCFAILAAVFWAVISRHKV
ncbi:MAG: SURF1 family protein [Steroidobacteraceae bacterium]